MPVSFEPDAAPGRTTSSAIARLFWIGLLLPVNLIFQPLLFSLENYRPALDAAPVAATLVKVGYFISVCFGFYMLARLWPELPKGRPKAAGICYRMAGLASVLGLIAIHAAPIYHYAEIERDIHRESIAVNRATPSWIGAGIRLDRLRLQANDMVYEITVTNADAGKMNLPAYGAAVSPSLRLAACSSQTVVRNLGHGIRLRYVFHDRNARPLLDTVVDQGNCTDKQR